MSDTYGLQQLSLETLATIDGGRVNLAMNQALRRIAQDLDDRPGESRTRKATLEVIAKPVCGEDGLIDGAKIQIQVKDDVPTRKSKVYDVGVRKGGMMVYQEMVPDDHRQNALPFGDEEEETDN